ncbi:MAG: acetolactate decarboxylase [Lewinellaceae bacterium]|nr:acetolactate decarboxylase [Phaeodactylibacter sp.]MCB0614881.1 acetolactate decarboxylase [Phaeodactylibacter sp.]MCB9348823.1 acetolactate decarboxylase [Lewinellaceae bacterium]
MKYCFVLFSMLILGSCQPQPTKDSRFELGWYGAMRSIMHEGGLSGQVGVADLLAKPHVYALGAMENLKGELLIWDGKPVIAQVKDSTLLLSQDRSGKAALAVYASVPHWGKVIPIPYNVRTYEELENFIKVAARKEQLDTEQPFPFLIEAKVNKLDYHIIDWPESDTVHTHEKHRQSGMQGALSSTPVKILGFYSAHHHGVFTHHSTNMHLHFMGVEAPIAGHVDSLILEKGMGGLFFPEGE